MAISALALLAPGIAAATATPAFARSAHGAFEVRVAWPGAPGQTFEIELDNHGVGRVAGSHATVAYTRAKRAFHMSITSNGAATTYDGLTTRNGINTARHQGAVTSAAGVHGTWYAVPLP